MQPATTARGRGKHKYLQRHQNLLALHVKPLPAREKVAPAPAEFSRSDLPRSVYAILEAGQLLDAHRPARMEAAGGDADLGAEAELAAIGELGRGVVQHNRGIDLVEEFFRRSMIFRHDRIGVV